jgi:CRISPR-associated protein Csb1
LIFGMWDSSGPKGGLGAKFERAITSEIVGIGARIGSRTQSRRDPVIGGNPTLYENAEGDWTADPDEAAPGANGPKKYSKKLSKLNLGSVTPDYARYDEKTITDENRETPDPLRGDGAYIRGGRIRPGGVTVDFAEQTTVISLPALRRLRFPPAGRWEPSVEQRRRDIAARTVLAALALCASELSSEAGLDLRSRCLLWPTAGRVWELLRAPGGNPVQYGLNGDVAVALLNGAVEAAQAIGIEWETQPIQLTPSDRLVKLVRNSQLKAVDEPEDQAADTESENTPL